MEGEMTKWKALRGEGRAIIPHIAGERDECHEEFCSVSLKDCGPTPHCTREEAETQRQEGTCCSYSIYSWQAWEPWPHSYRSMAPTGRPVVPFCSTMSLI